MRPPTREQTDAWLKGQSAAVTTAQALSEASARGEGSGFVMDPNTGKLVGSMFALHLPLHVMEDSTLSQC